ncbi:MAG: response regulator [bacterium]
MNILIVDDKIENLYLLESLLNGSGYKTIIANNGAEALGFAHKNKPDLIISDILMPVMDGYTLCRECKKDEILNEIPFIFYTATYTDPKDEEFALNLGADKFLLKPIDPDYFLEVISITLNESQKKTINSINVPELAETVILKEYNETLIRKLEDKMTQSELSEKELKIKNNALQKEIEERKRAEKTIREYSANLNSLINTRNELIWSIDSEFHFIIFNKFYQEFCEELYNIKIEHTMDALLLFKDEELTFWKTKYSMAISGQKIKFELKVLFRNLLHYFEVFLNPIISDEGVTGLSAISVDITERKQAVMELRAAKEKAEEMNRLKTSFLANMSHELRTPLLGILGYAEILTEELASATHLNMLNNIVASGKRLSETLQLILDLANAESNKLKVVENSIEVNQTVKNTLEFFYSKANKKQLFLEYQMNDENILAKLDDRLFTRIISNLIDNAIKYTNKGKITVQTGKEIINESLWVFIKVIDTGIGIDQKHQKMIFDEFRQASEGWGRSFEGSGLGLTISKKMTEVMNGTISVESEINKGSIFTIKFPIDLENNYHVKNVATNEIIKIKNKETFSVLYVEDEEINRNLIRLYLKNFYLVDTAANGKDALKMVKENNYDLFLMDINLGKDMNGLQVAQEIKKMENYKTTPIIAVTAYTMAGDKESFLENGCSHYLAKPFNKDDLLKLISNALK